MAATVFAIRDAAFDFAAPFRRHAVFAAAMLYFERRYADAMRICFFSPRC